MYEIIINKIEEKEKVKREYQVIKESDEKDSDGYFKKEYGYVEVPQIEEETIKIYNQITDKEIDLKKIIDAFNN